MAEQNWYDKYYKILGLFTILLTLSAVSYVFYFYSQNNDVLYKDVSLTGGTVITVSGQAEIGRIRESLPDNVLVRQLSDLQTGRQIGFSVETAMHPEEIQPLIEKALGYNLTEQNSSIEFTGPNLSSSFYRELINALIMAFIFMALVVFFLFRTFIPSMAVIQAAFTDITVTLAVINLIEFKLSAAGIAAFLMLVGYSVDTDILLTNKVLKNRGEGTLNHRIKSAFATGMTMTITSLAVVFVGLLIVRNLSSVLTEIFTVLSIGLVVDMIATWCGNAAILKFYCEKKGIS